MNNNKFHLHCTQCGYDVADFKEWFEYMQKCPKCGCAVVDVQYSKDYSALKDMIFSNGSEPKNLWHYFDFLPLNNRENIISRGEGVIPLEQWGFWKNMQKKNLA
jgi:threonine synthase